MRRPAKMMAEIGKIGLLAIAIVGSIAPAEGASPSAPRVPVLQSLRLIPDKTELLGPDSVQQVVVEGIAGGLEAARSDQAGRVRRARTSRWPRSTPRA